MNEVDKKNISMGKQTNNSLKSYPILEFERRFVVRFSAR